jgi:ABC-type tungstate transport system permease subunit
MNILEHKIWRDLQIHPQGDTCWEVSNKFMLASLLDADKKGQYHMLDSSTWVLHMGNEGQKIIADFGVKQYGEAIYHPTVIKNPK